MGKTYVGTLSRGKDVTPWGAQVAFCELASCCPLLLQVVVWGGWLGLAGWSRQEERETIWEDERLLCSGASAHIRVLRKLLKTLTH